MGLVDVVDEVDGMDEVDKYYAFPRIVGTRRKLSTSSTASTEPKRWGRGMRS